MKLTKVELDYSEIKQLSSSTDVIRTCPNIADKAIGFHRSFKSLEAVLKEVNEELENVNKIHTDKLDKLSKDYPDKEKSELYKSNLKELVKESQSMIDTITKEKRKVGVYIYKLSDFPKDPKSFGIKEMVLTTQNDKGSEATVAKLEYWEEFVKTIDYIVYDDEQYEQLRLKEKI